MKFTSKNENYLSSKGKGWLKNPFVVPSKIIDEAGSEKAIVEFNFCVEENSQVRVLETQSLSFTKFNIDAMIEVTTEVDGVTVAEAVDLINYLESGGEYIKENVLNWGHPKYSDLSSYFTADFSPIEFKDSPMKFLALDWALNVIKIEGVALKEHFELEVV